jgi:hypothetical protein
MTVGPLLRETVLHRKDLNGVDDLVLGARAVLHQLERHLGAPLGVVDRSPPGAIPGSGYEVVPGVRDVNPNGFGVASIPLKPATSVVLLPLDPLLDHESAFAEQVGRFPERGPDTDCRFKSVAIAPLVLGDELTSVSRRGDRQYGSRRRGSNRRDQDGMLHLVIPHWMPQSDRAAEPKYTNAVRVIDCLRGSLRGSGPAALSIPCLRAAPPPPSFPWRWAGELSAGAREVFVDIGRLLNAGVSGQWTRPGGLLRNPCPKP